MKGKKKCEILRSIRESMAESNGIEYTPKECEHSECSTGTCPQCEKEAEYITEEIRKKEDAGTPMTIDPQSLDDFEVLEEEITDEGEGEWLIRDISTLDVLDGIIMPEDKNEELEKYFENISDKDNIDKDYSDTDEESREEDDE